MRDKQQKVRPRATAMLAVFGCVISGLTAAALATPAVAAAGQHGSSAAPDVQVTGEPIGMAADPTTHSFWVAAVNPGGTHDVVGRIAETGHKVTTLNVTSGVNAIAVDSATGMVWTTSNSSDGGTHTVTFIKESNNSIGTTTVGASSDLTGIATDPATGTVFVLDSGGDVFTISEAHPTNTPFLLVTGSGGESTTGLAVDHGTGEIWVVSAGGNSVFAFNESTGTAIGSPASIGNNPGSIAIDTTTKTVWVANADSTISEFAEATPATVRTIPLASIADSLTADSSKGIIWAGTLSGSIFGITEKTSPPSGIGSLTLTNTVDGLATDPSTGQLWAAEQIVSQGTFENVFPFVPSASTISSANNFWFATNNPAHAVFQVTTGGFPPAQFTISGAPSFVSIGKLTGILAGKLTAKTKLGAVKFTIKATNGIGKTATQAFTLNLGTDPTGISSTATFAIGVKNTFQLKAKASPAATFQGIALPSGVTLSKSGVLSGSLPKGTKSPVKFFLLTNNKVTEAFGQPVETIFSIKLAPGKAAKITSAGKVTFKHGKHGSFTIKSTGFPTPTLTEKGKLPKGLSFKAASHGTATISGTPAASDKGHTTKVTITATNGVGKHATQTLTIKVT